MNERRKNGVEGRKEGRKEIAFADWTVTKEGRKEKREERKKGGRKKGEEER